MIKLLRVGSEHELLEHIVFGFGCFVDFVVVYYWVHFDLSFDFYGFVELVFEDVERRLLWGFGLIGRIIQHIDIRIMLRTKTESV